MTKRVLAWMLVLAMSLAVFGLGGSVAAADPVVAPAAFSDISGHNAEFELTAMAALGIMSGDVGVGGPVRPNDLITRAEVAKILVGALGKGNFANMMAAQPMTFKDADQVPVWARGWINTAQMLGLMNGYNDNTIRANDMIKNSEVIAMLIRCVAGHDYVAKLAPAPWPMNYLIHAVEWGFTGEDMVYPELPATRGDVAKWIYATMQVNRITPTGGETANTALLTDRVVTGALVESTTTHATVGTTQKPLADRYWIIGASSLSALSYLEVEAIADASGEWVVFKKIGTSSAAGGIFASLDTSGTTDYIVFKDGRKVPYTSPVAVTRNGQTGLTETALQNGDEVTVIAGSDGFAVTATAFVWDVATDYIISFSQSTSSADTRITLRSAGTFSIPSSCTVKINGSSSSRDSLRVDDVVRIATRGGSGTTPINIFAIRRTVEGTVHEVATSYPGPVYTVTLKSGSQTNSYQINNARGYFSTAPAQGTYAKYGLDENNKIFVPIVAAAPADPLVLVKGYSTSSAGNSVVVDNRGSAATYSTTVDFSGLIGTFGLLDLDNTGKAVAFTPATILSTPQWQVMSHSANDMTVQEVGGTTTRFLLNADVRVYKDNGDNTYTYLGTGGVSNGNVLTTDADGKFWIYTP